MPQDVVFNQKKLAGSIVGGRADMQEMLDFAALEGIKPKARSLSASSSHCSCGARGRPRCGMVPRVHPRARCAGVPSSVASTHVPALAAYAFWMALLAAHHLSAPKTNRNPKNNRRSS